MTPNSAFLRCFPGYGSAGPMRDQIQNFVQSRFRFARDQHGLRQCERNLAAIDAPQLT